MKKIISVFLAIVMIFTVTTIAFAAEDPTDEPTVDESTTVESEETTGGILDNVEDLPLWTVKVGLKVGKVIIKIVAVIVKVGMALGLIDSDELLQKVKDMFGGNTDEVPEETTTETVAAIA